MQCFSLSLANWLCVGGGGRVCGPMKDDGTADRDARDKWAERRHGNDVSVSVRISSSGISGLVAGNWGKSGFTKKIRPTSP